jgi:multiple sugar transport system ATP-binding protein
MGDRVAVLKDGILQQVDTPRNLYEKPQNVFVAGFIGSPAMNLLTASVSGGKAMLGNLGIAVPSTAGSSVTVGIRPEGLAPVQVGLEVLVEVVEELGSDAYVYGKPVDNLSLLTLVRRMAKLLLDGILRIHLRLVKL